jgi:hypothetical protein
VLRSITCILLLLLGACGGGSSSTPSGPPAAPPSVTRLILPSATDPAIATYLNPHVAINPDPAVPAKNGLFLFLVGTGGQPQNQQLIQSAGAARGYHVIGLMYPNTPTVGSLCADSTDPNAYWDVRREIITGQDLSPLISISPTECLEHRLVALLTYLTSTYPTEGWGHFLVSSQPDWSKVTVAGHSQGGGHAGVIGKLHAVARVVCFSSPADWRNPVNLPAPWFATPGATGADRVFGFSHQQDEVVTWPLVTANWAALGLDAFGAAVNVDSTSAPYANSHKLTTNLAHAPASGYPAPLHSAPVVDLVMPKLGDGSPAYRPVWIQLCFP